MAKRGWTDEQMAELLGVTEQTLNNWKSKHRKFFESLKNAKEYADDLVVKSLYEQALDGNTTAMIFWLKNRQPGKWRDKQDLEHKGSLNYDITISFVEPDGKD